MTANQIVETKVDTQEKLAAVAGQPTKNFLFANEINTIVDTLQEISEVLQHDPAIIQKIITALENRLRFDINSQGLSSVEKANALVNLGIVTADLLNRANHTGDQPASSISDFSAAVSLLLETFKTSNFLDFASSGQTQLNTKSNRAVADTGYVISFDTPKIYNDNLITLSSAVITNNLTGAQKGIVQKMYIKTSAPNPFPAGWVPYGFVRYTASALTVVYAEWAGGSRVEYWLEKPTS